MLRFASAYEHDTIPVETWREVCHTCLQNKCEPKIIMIFVHQVCTKHRSKQTTFVHTAVTNVYEFFKFATFIFDLP